MSYIHKNERFYAPCTQRLRKSSKGYQTLTISTISVILRYDQDWSLRPCALWWIFSGDWWYKSRARSPDSWEGSTKETQIQRQFRDAVQSPIGSVVVFTAKRREDDVSSDENRTFIRTEWVFRYQPKMNRFFGGRLSVLMPGGIWAANIDEVASMYYLPMIHGFLISRGSMWKFCLADVVVPNNKEEVCRSKEIAHVHHDLSWKEVVAGSTDGFIQIADNRRTHRFGDQKSDAVWLMREGEKVPGQWPGSHAVIQAASDAWPVSHFPSGYVLVTEQCRMLVFSPSGSWFVDPFRSRKTERRGDVSHMDCFGQENRTFSMALWPGKFTPCVSLSNFCNARWKLGTSQNKTS